MPSPRLPVTGDSAADTLIDQSAFARLIGMLLDQQVTMESAFMAPLRMQERLDGHFDPTTIASMDPEKFMELFRIKPALHRFPGSMAKRVQAVSDVIVEQYGGDTERIWTEATSGAELYDRVHALPGFGEEKARIFVAMLAKRFDVRPEGWARAAGPFADDAPRSVADIDSREGFERVRAWKKQQKAKGLGKGD